MSDENALDLRSVSFLIVDDNAHMRHIIKMMVWTLGSKKCMEALGGREAFEALRANPVDIILCDWAMQPMDGLTFTRRLRAMEDSPLRFVPVIMVTGHTERIRIMQARDAGVTEFVAKPVSVKALYQRIASVVLRPRPFVKSADYFGPDRRRHDEQGYGKFSWQRRESDKTVNDEPEAAAEEEEVAAMSQEGLAGILGGKV